MKVPYLSLDNYSPSQVRFGGFIALSALLHLLTVAGVGPLDLSARRLGDSAARGVELHAVLAPGDGAQAAPAPSSPAPDTDAAEPVKDGPAPPAAGERTATPEPATTDSAARTGAAATESALALSALDKWYTAQEVDVRAEPLTPIRLRYPEHLRGEAVVGRVRLRLFIDERGVVRKIQLAGSEPSGMFDEAARQGWEDIRFSPALRQGAPVKSQKLLELTYEPGLM